MFRNAMFTLLGIALLSPLSLLSPSSILAQDLPLREFYGQGVHAYFAGEYKDALENLSAAADGDSDDPRVYYFRALTLIQLDRAAEAQDDFIKGADYEIADANQIYPVSKSLERIQGRTRLKLERHRAKARIERFKKRQAAIRARYERVQEAGADTVRSTIDGDDPPVLPKDEPKTTTPAADPFDNTPKPPAPAPQPATTPKPDEADPFGAVTPKPAPAAKPDEADDPFGAAPAEPSLPEPEKKPAPAAEKEPADDKKPADKDDPFGGAPADDKKPADKDDPFGDDADDATDDATDDAADDATDDAAKPADKKPADDDPFGA